ncbi:hypothetical protein ACDZ28_04110 [Paenibacillus sp. RS8]|uniref:hypothetical protein n=1 Tax=Paenibacillus sp. RS8 TaxID=3242681 RepID=UPI0035C16590
MSTWNKLTRVNKTRKDHKCAATGRTIPSGSSCWNYRGEYEGEFQNWHMCDEAKEFMDANPSLFNDPDGYECAYVGEMLDEAKHRGDRPKGIVTTAILSVAEAAGLAVLNL